MLINGLFIKQSEHYTTDYFKTYLLKNIPDLKNKAVDYLTACQSII